MLLGSSLQVHVPSADVSPQTVFGSLDPKGLAALQAAFHDNFADKGNRAKVSLADAWRSANALCICWPDLHVCHILHGGYMVRTGYCHSSQLQHAALLDVSHDLLQENDAAG